MEGISRLIYPAYSLAIPERCIKEINRIHYNFIWNNKQHMIRKSDMVKLTEEGGINVIDFGAMNGVIKLRWLQSFVKDEKSLWFSLPFHLFQRVGGIYFLLRCDFEPLKLPLKLSDFHMQVLLYWKMLYKHNFSPHKAIIWNNRCILHKRKSLFYKDWMEKGVWAVIHLMDEDGNMLSSDNFKTKNNFECSYRQYSVVIKAIPVALRNLIKGILQYSSVIPTPLELFVEKYNFLDENCNNKVLRSLITKEYFPLPVKRKNLSSRFSIADTIKVRTRYLSFPLLPKMKEVHFKTINDIYPCNDFLRIRFNLESNVCTFCQKDIESQEHLFYNCTVVKSFWDRLYEWLETKNVIPAFDYHNVKFGVFLDNKDIEFLCNNVLIVAKFYLHKCRFVKVSPCFEAFKNDFIILFDSIKHLKMRSALKLFKLLAKYMD